MLLIDSKMVCCNLLYTGNRNNQDTFCDNIFNFSKNIKMYQICIKLSKLLNFVGCRCPRVSAQGKRNMFMRTRYVIIVM